MLRIDCPNCGPRAEIEFRCGGEGHVERPGVHSGTDGEVSDEAWSDYLFYRQNPKGEHRERWLHFAGCGRWFNIARCTVTHRIRAVYPMGAACPEDVA